jgi:alkanal monooxygenase alpha chain
VKHDPEGLQFDILMTTAQPPELTQQQVFDNSLQLARHAERLGFGGAWILEHHFTRYGLCSNPLTMAAFILGTTERLRVGTAVSVLPLYHPVQLAEQVALLDRLSGGRFDLGIGRGQFAKDFEVFDVDPQTSHTVMHEWIEIMEMAWRDPVVEWNGRHATIPPVPVYPTPQSPEGPSVRVVADSASTTEWAASKGYPMMLGWWLDHDAMRSQLDLYDEVARAHGHDPAGVDHVAACIVSVAETREAAADGIRDTLRWWRQVAEEVIFKFEELRKLSNYKAMFRRWEEFTLAAGGDAARGQEDALQRLLDINIVGTPDDCVARLRSLVRATGIRHFICGFEGWRQLPLIERNMESFAERVVPFAGD